MVSILQKEWNKLHRTGGRPSKLTIPEKLTLTLKHLREYRTMESVGSDYEVRESAVCEIIQWVETTLLKDKAFQPPGEKILQQKDAPIRYIVVDTTESPIHRPKKTKKSGIPGKRSGVP
ncbi:MAG: transposase family protein [Treponema sp.]|jgi:hypothetical protein|nr:transposase family protein [Treponema sp.]